MSRTKISWAEYSWNPIVGCTKCSPGCLNCYAERMAKRLYHMGMARPHTLPEYMKFEDGWKNGHIELCEHRLEQPLNWKKPRRIFVCSMGDLFHPKVEIGYLTHVFDIIEQCPQHTFQILTKRPEQALKMMWGKHDEGWRYFGDGDYHPNIHLGVSISTQAEADEKIPILLQIPAAVRFVSFEPLLEGIMCPLAKLDGLDWAIFGCESLGNKAGRFCVDEEEFCRSTRIIAHQIKYGLKKPVFIKQLPINGKVSRNPEEWPVDLRIQDYT